MWLQIDGQPATPVKDRAALRAACDCLSSDGPRFAILSTGSSGDHFVQAYACDDGTLDFEIQRGGIERHFRVDKRLTRDDVLALFEAYFERGDLPDDVPLVTMEVW